MQEEDEDIKKALAESMRDVSEQENGTISSGQHFGPAQRSHYPASQWALAPIASAREVVEHPQPSERRRLPGQPAFLRGSPETGYNAALLNIYHSIPLAREALVFPPLKIAAYGHSPDWWSGTSDENLKHLSLEEVLPGDEDKRRFAAELQCLMAFLDNTSRAYGSVDALSEMHYYQRTTGDSSTSKLFEAWRRACVEDFPDESLSQVFTTVATRGPEVEGALPEERDMLQIEGSTNRVQTQSEFLDKLVWVDSWQTPPEDVWMDRFGHILTLRLRNPEVGAKGLGIVPDQVWYLDRYMPEMREALLEMRRKRYGLFQAINRLDRTKSRLAEMPPLQANAPRVHTKPMLEAAKGLISLAVDDALPSNDRDEFDVSNTDTDRIQRQIDILISKVEESLTHLDSKRTELEEQAKIIMSDLRNPEHSTIPLRQKYMLHGVSTKPNVTYFRRLNQDLIGLEDEDEDEPHEIWQWWRTAWSETQDPVASPPDSQTNEATTRPEVGVPFSVTRVSHQQVLDAVRDENNSAVLVYADETALTHNAYPLAASLREFVETDNRAFDEEIRIQHGQNSDHSRGRSTETNSTVMDEGDPFDDASYSYNNRQFTPMSTSTIRSLSGQPSPKRPRSSDSMQNMNLMDDPPAYDDIAGPSPEEPIQNKGNKIGYFAEQLLHNVEQNEPRS